MAACATGTGEGGADRVCLAEPLGAVVAFLQEPAPPPSARFAGTVTASPPSSEPDVYHYVFRDAAGGERRLTYRAPGGPLPLKEGFSYEVQVDHVGGFPPASGILIRDRGGLLFAGASDQQVGSHVLKEGVPLLTLALLPPSCPSRRRDTCFDAIANVPLQVRSADRSVRLHNGESARLGLFRVTCLTAQAVSYRAGCADAGLPAVSYVIQRVE